MKDKKEKFIPKGVPVPEKYLSNIAAITSVELIDKEEKNIFKPDEVTLMSDEYHQILCDLSELMLKNGIAKFSAKISDYHLKTLKETRLK